MGNVGGGGLVDSFWSKVDLSVTNSNYWTEKGHANGVSDFDSDYWQQIKPGMNRFDESGAGSKLSSIDYTIWAQVGGVGGFDGDGKWGNRDAAEEGIPDDGNFSYGTWSGSAAQGEYVEHGGKVYQARIATTNQPGSAGSEGCFRRPSFA